MSIVSAVITVMLIMVYDPAAKPAIQNYSIVLPSPERCASEAEQIKVRAAVAKVHKDRLFVTCVPTKFLTPEQPK